METTALNLFIMSDSWMIEEMAFDSQARFSQIANLCGMKRKFEARQSFEVYTACCVPETVEFQTDIAFQS